MGGNGYIRIGELSRRVGVNPELLRAWERRYGLLEPSRSPGGFRLYSDADVARVEQMKLHLAEGLSAAEAARLAKTSEVAAPGGRDAAPLLDSALADLRRALASFDEPAAHAALDRLLASFGLDTVLREAVLPLLRELGESWARGETTVAQEHFSSNLLRGRLLALGRGWGRGSGPHALLAAPPGELHDLGLVVFGLALRNRGWRITFLGADTPIETIAETAERVAPQLVVLATLLPSRIGSVLDGVRSLAARWRVVLAGAGVTSELAEQVGAEQLADGPLEAADRLSSALGR
ncbi:MAG: HTH-type transcriptional repressor CarH [Gaiellaceae bacterium]|nr:MAG: HTH-type transcriptional repressor CarH [Gaiellaceae bacterium]